MRPTAVFTQNRTTTRLRRGRVALLRTYLRRTRRESVRVERRWFSISRADPRQGLERVEPALFPGQHTKQNRPDPLHRHGKSTLPPVRLAECRRQLQLRRGVELVQVADAVRISRSTWR